jgi:hypothetical protein
MPQLRPRIIAYQNRRPRRLVLLAALTTALLATLTLVSLPASAAASHNPGGRLDSVAFVGGQLQVYGWALDPDTHASIRVHIYIDGAGVALTANRSRSDIARLHKGFGPAHGFLLRTNLATGTHSVCAYAINVGAGKNTNLGCRTIVINNNPIGAITGVTRVPTGLHITGWALDPNSTASIRTSIYVDQAGKTVTANLPVSAAVAKAHSGYGVKHGFDVTLPAPAGTRNVCVYGINLGIGVTKSVGCRAVAVSDVPYGHLDSIRRIGTTNQVAVTGWAIDPDTTGPVTVGLTATLPSAAVATTVLAASSRPDLLKVHPGYGAAHGFSGTFTVDANEHTICLRLLNVAPGGAAGQSSNCADLYAAHPSGPGAPNSVQAWPGSSAGIVGWAPPSITGGAAITGYRVTASPGGKSITVGSTVNQATVPGLRNGIRYHFTVAAINAKGAGTAALTGWIIPSPIPPQITPAPTSTSRYLRDLTNSATANAATMRARGAADATANPSGHRYLNLLQVGGQDESNKGAILSATSRFVSYPNVVAALKAYLDGYAARQKSYAPVTIAVGTNNDIDVSRGSGASWATNVVNPLSAYAARYPGITIAGANDIEPGFSGSAAESRAWLTGYLSATKATFVFNGSADGCSTNAWGSHCNNGWTMSDLQWLAGGAAPARIAGLPQIYFTAMPLQWKYISLTGTKLKRAKLYFGGPLTEVAACSHAGSCESMSNHTAWSQLWSAISSLPQTKQYDMPHGTDLRIN